MKKLEEMSEQSSSATQQQVSQKQLIEESPEIDVLEELSKNE